MNKETKMKGRLAILLSTWILMTGWGDALAGTPIEVDVPVNHVYVSRGFDSNDNVEIVISGVLPNLCHKYPDTTVKVQGNKIVLDVHALKYEPTNPFCPEVVVPFLNPIQLGTLKAGTYQILVNRGTSVEKQGQIEIQAASSSNVDDHIYAVTNYIEMPESLDSNGERLVYINGYTPSDCLEFDRVEVISNGEDTYAILPIMKQVRDFCPMKMMPMRVPVKLPADLSSEGLLLHVRSMDGKSVNTIYSH